MAKAFNVKENAEPAIILHQMSLKSIAYFSIVKVTASTMLGE
jgi:hypothetical protein